MVTYYDDNFGTWDIQDEDDVDHYRRTQATNVRKQCKGCRRWVRIQPDYAYCNACAEKIERGLDPQD